MNRLISVLLLWLAVTVQAQAASFDCEKAQSKVEHLVCGDSKLSKLDQKLAKTFGEDYTTSLSKQDDELAQIYQDDLKKTDAEQKQQLITEQKHWLKNTRNVCQDITCLKLAYWSRQAALETFFVPKSPLYEHESEKAGAIQKVLATTQLELIGGATGAANFCTRMLGDLKQMKGIRFVDPIVQTQSYEDPALDPWKRQCKGKPPLNFSRGCLPNIAKNLPAGKEGFADSLAECDVGFGLPPFKLYELTPIELTDKSRIIFYSDDAYGPMNLSWKKPSLGGGFSGFRQIDQANCRQVEDVFTQAGRGGRNGENYNSIIKYKRQYYFLVLNKEVDSWWLNAETITPNGTKEQKVCNWSPVIPDTNTPNNGRK